ncbi:NUDIX domain-containing protein [Kosakonia cowanii]|jgi:nudix-type nucleoside diphosphatase (YffH/AdpP family)|uniref:NUDIX domain-containing protein n=1 Tax=Kosakonia cowanii TaxID=208223 RepID=UPI001F5778FC|nr:NUDIX domain-containing protein [Kosakonia cowanii]MDT3412805.1 nudix-type nucleoside diphosphatase (YffH/AdpP family) [Atlantibacter sp. SORGH_AS_0304]
MQTEQAQARIIAAIPLSQDWGKLTKYTFDFRRRNGEWQRQSREVYDRGNGATILLYNRSKRSVILTRQFRLPLFVNDHAGFLLEAAAGLLDELDAETRIKQEAEEETGYRLERVEKVFEAWMSPGSVSEKLHFFIAEYDESRRTGNGGGLVEEGEDIEVVEMTFTDALAAIRSGEIADGKTIMLLQHLALEGVL